jgi:hypothetical protein
MRVRITRQIHETVDGIDLTAFEVGQVYDVGTTVANYLLAAGYAIPVVEEPTSRGARSGTDPTVLA